MNRFTLAIAVILGFFGVALGAFGAHGLKEVVTPDKLEVWKTAVSYQMYHVPVMLILCLAPSLDNAWRQRAILCFLVGVLFFSGSLYLLVGLNLPKLGMVTPLGGVLLLAGWASLLIAVIRKS